MRRDLRETHVLLLFCLIVFLGQVSPNEVVALSVRRNVLVIHSYHPTLAWTRDIQRGVDEAIASFEEPVELFVEFLDAKRVPGMVAGVYRDHLAGRYGDVKWDAVLVSDDTALDLANELRSDFLAGVPVVFAGVDHVSLRPELRQAAWLTGVAERVDLLMNIELILDLWPNTLRILLLGDETAIAENHRRAALPLIEEFADRVAIRTLVPEDLAGMRRELSELGPGDVVFYLHFHYTETDGYLPFEDVIPEIAEISPVPVVGAWDFSIHYGLAAGYVTTGYRQGLEAGTCVIRILRGEPVSEMPIIENAANTFMVNYPAAVQYAAALDVLPEEAVLLFRDPGFFERNREGLAVAGSLILLLLFVIVIVLIYARERRRAELKLVVANSRLAESSHHNALLVRETHHRVKNNLQVLSSLIGLESSRHRDEKTLQALDALRSRVEAITLVHQQLYTAGSVAEVDASVYFAEFLRQYARIGAKSEALGDAVAEKKSHEESSVERLRISSHIPSLRLSAEEVVPLGLLVSEALSNAMKHGITAGSDVAEVNITLYQDDKRRTALIADSGPGFPDDMEADDGLGLTLMQALAEQLSGSVELYNDNGAVVHLSWGKEG